MINQLNSENKQVVNLRKENDILVSDLRVEKETNERMMRSQEVMDQLAKLSNKIHKGKVVLFSVEPNQSPSGRLLVCGD